MRDRGVAWLTRRPVKPEIASSNLVGPATTFGSHYTFRVMAFSLNCAVFSKMNDNLSMRLAEILSEDRVKIPLEKTDKQSIIEEMVGVIDDSVSLPDRSQILKAVLDREKVMSTGVGEEVAIPHGKCDGVNDIVAALGITREPVDFNSLDDKPVRLIWLLIGPQDKTGPHLKALSRISRLMHRKDFRERLLDTVGPRAIIEAISSEEQKYLE